MPPLAALPALAARVHGRTRGYAGTRAAMRPGMTKLIILCSLSLSLAACKDKSPSCDDVVAHTMSLLPPELAGQIKKPDALAKCEKLSPEARACAMKATSMEDLMKCPKS